MLCTTRAHAPLAGTGQFEFRWHYRIEEVTLLSAHATLQPLFGGCSGSSSGGLALDWVAGQFFRCLRLTFAVSSLTMSFMATLTKRQWNVYDFLSRFMTENDYSPSFEEIKEGVGLNSVATVHKHITNLEKKGFIKRSFNRSRSIELLPLKGKLKQSVINTGVVLPLMGRIAAGRPIEAVQTPETISLADFVQSKEVFVLEVRGDSMQDEAILDGDYVLVEKTKTAHNGDIVVALVNGSDATLKRFFREGDSIRLQPSNVNMSPIVVHAAAVQIQGRVIGVLRKY